MRGTAAERFAAKVKKTKYCWEFIGARQPKGYGTFYINGKTEQAHRASWMMKYGQIPDGLFVLHHCDNPPCVRPDHLFLGTNLDNARDCVAKGRRIGNIGSVNGRAKMTDDIVRLIRSEYIPGRSGPNTSSNIQELAHRHGVTKTAALLAIKGKTWRHVK